MKVAESWLRSWVNPELTTTELAHRFTMLGHEVDGVETMGAGLGDVIIGEILSFEKHPDADRLNVCQVATGDGDNLEIVCGAPNVRVGMKPLSVGSWSARRCPEGLAIQKSSEIRGERV